MWPLRQFATCLLLPAAAVVMVVQANLNYVGCFSDPVGLVDMGSNTFQSRGLCAQRCAQIDQWVVGLTNGTRCLCGSRVPPTHYLVDDGACNSRCSGYAMESCGGRGYLSVLVRDIELLQQQRAAESTDMSEKVQQNLRAGSY